MRKNEGIRRRLAPHVEGDRRRIGLLHGLLLSLPGSPVLYYGDEIGMGDECLLQDRDGVRTPMQWEQGPGAGFSTAEPGDFYLPTVTDPAYSPDALNVASQRADPGSLLLWIRDLLAVRRRHPEMGVGAFEVLEHGNDAVFAFMRSAADASTLVVANFTDSDQQIRVGAATGRASGTDLMTGEAIDPSPDSPWGPMSSAGSVSNDWAVGPLWSECRRRRARRHFDVAAATEGPICGSPSSGGPGWSRHHPGHPG